MPIAFKAGQGRFLLSLKALFLSCLTAWSDLSFLFLSDLSVLFFFFMSYRIRAKPGTKGMCQV